MTSLKVHDEPFDRVCGEWAGLVEMHAPAGPFITPAWQRVWLEHFQDGRDVHILTARDGERLIGVAPLLRDGARAELVGHYSICDYMDVAVTPGFERSFLAVIVEHLAADGVAEFDARGLHSASQTADALVEVAQTAGYTATRELEALAPAVELAPTWEDYLALLSKKDRHELRRKLRRLDQAGGEVALRIATEPDECCGLLDEFFRLMRISSHHKEEFLERPGMEPFFRAMTATMAAESMVRFYVLTFDAVPVAAVMNFDFDRRLYMYNSGYDPEYAHYAVGLMSKALLVKDAIETGHTCVDFLRGDENYKYDLGGKDQEVYRVVLKR